MRSTTRLKRETGTTPPGGISKLPPCTRTRHHSVSKISVRIFQIPSDFRGASTVLCAKAYLGTASSPWATFVWRPGWSDANPQEPRTHHVVLFTMRRGPGPGVENQILLTRSSGVARQNVGASPAVATRSALEVQKGPKTPQKTPNSTLDKNLKINSKSRREGLSLFSIIPPTPRLRSPGSR